MAERKSEGGIDAKNSPHGYGGLKSSAAASQTKVAYLPERKCGLHASGTQESALTARRAKAMPPDDMTNIRSEGTDRCCWIATG